MKNIEYALGSWELHLQTNEERLYILSKFSPVCKYIDTAINYNNDYLLSTIRDYKIISKIAPCHLKQYEFFVSNHLKCLNRNKIDIMLIHSSRGNWIDLADRLEHDNRFVEIGVSNFNKNELIQYFDVFGHFPKYNEIEINVHYADIETIEFCLSHNIKLIAYGVFGGKYNAMRNISDYSIAHLIKLARKYADIIIVKPESFRQANEIFDVISTTYFNAIQDIDFHITTKAIEPMKYAQPHVVKSYCRTATYNNVCANNNGCMQGSSRIIDIELPKFEMLGDYMTYIRYLFRSDYRGKIYDDYYLIGDDGCKYIVYLTKNGYLTKINDNSSVTVVKVEV